MDQPDQRGEVAGALELPRTSMWQISFPHIASIQRVALPLWGAVIPEPSRHRGGAARPRDPCRRIGVDRSSAPDGRPPRHAS